MDIAGFEIPFWLIATVAIGFCFAACWKMSAEDDKSRSDPKKSWSPDVDQKKAGAMRNHGPAGMER